MTGDRNMVLAHTNCHTLSHTHTHAHRKINLLPTTHTPNKKIALRMRKCIEYE